MSAQPIALEGKGRARAAQSASQAHHADPWAVYGEPLGSAWACWIVDLLLRLEPPVIQQEVPEESIGVEALHVEGTPAVVHAYLERHSARWHRLSEIAAETGKNPRTVSWALNRLQQLLLIESCGVGQPGCNSRYRRYRLRCSE